MRQTYFEQNLIYCQCPINIFNNECSGGITSKNIPADGKTFLQLLSAKTALSPT